MIEYIVKISTLHIGTVKYIEKGRGEAGVDSGKLKKYY